MTTNQEVKVGNNITSKEVMLLLVVKVTYTQMPPRSLFIGFLEFVGASLSLFGMKIEFVFL